MALFGIKEIIKVKWDHKGRALIWQDWPLMSRERDFRGVRIQEKKNLQAKNKQIFK